MIVTLSLFRFGNTFDRLWAFSQMGLARGKIAGIDGIQSFKMMGTGAGAGFSTTPNWSVYTLLCVWKDKAAAKRGLNTKVLSNYRNHCVQTADLFLSPTQARGEWAGAAPFGGGQDFAKQTTPIVALTRATIKPRHAMRFWSHVPAISDDVEGDDHKMFMMGMGEVPWLHQVTFSIWNDLDAMTQFSLKSASHGEAVKLAYTKGWFSEQLFARFNLIAIEGEWTGLEAFTGHDANFSEAAE